MVDILDEAREELKKEQAAALAKKYGVYVAAALILLIIGVVGWQAWQRHQLEAASEASRDYFAALELMQGGKTAEAAAKLEVLAKNAPSGFAAASSMLLASRAVTENKTDEAITAYRKIADDHGKDKAFRELASLMAVHLAIEHGKADDKTVAELKDLTGTHGVWRFSALELLGLYQLQQKQYAEAKESFTAISTDPNTPGQMRQRAGDMLLSISMQEEKK